MLFCLSLLTANICSQFPRMKLIVNKLRRTIYPSYPNLHAQKKEMANYGKFVEFTQIVRDVNLILLLLSIFRQFAYLQVVTHRRTKN